MVGGFGKTQIRVDAYFMLKKTETDWAPKRARPAGPRTPGRPAWAFSAPFGPIFCVLILPFIPHLSPVVTMRQNISKNVQIPVKMQHAPKSRTKSKMVKFGCQVAW